MKNVLCALLAVTLALPASSAFASDSRDSAAAAPLAQSTFQASIDRAIARVDVAPPVAFAQTPAPRPRVTTDRSRKQMGGGGGSKMGMILGLVGTAAGIGMTVYMVKQMKDSNNSVD